MDTYINDFSNSLNKEIIEYLLTVLPTTTIDTLLIVIIVIIVIIMIIYLTHGVEIVIREILGIIEDLI